MKEIRSKVLRALRFERISIWADLEVKRPVIPGEELVDHTLE